MWPSLSSIDVSFERYIKIFKNYDWNYNHPEGCIAESYDAEEALEFYANHISNMCTVGLPLDI